MVDIEKSATPPLSAPFMPICIIANEVHYHRRDTSITVTLVYSTINYTFIQ